MIYDLKHAEGDEVTVECLGFDRIRVMAVAPFNLDMELRPDCGKTDLMSRHSIGTIYDCIVKNGDEVFPTQIMETDLWHDIENGWQVLVDDPFAG